MITEEENLQLRRQGGIARAMGQSEFDNPFYKSDAMPGVTGEPMDLWKAKQAAWHHGWAIEDAMRND
jgi:hypothetical protein